jgi:hypothetical protein
MRPTGRMAFDNGPVENNYLPFVARQTACRFTELS